MSQQKQVGEIISAPERLEQYVIKGMLGQGAAGYVYLVELLQKDSQIPSSMYAMKVQSNLEKNEEQIMKVLMNNPSPNLLNIQKYWQSNGTFFILMDLASDGNLFEFMERKKNTFTSQIVQEIFRQLCLGVLQLHKLNIIHRDLKPENILIQTSPKNKNIFTLKICDYGLCKQSTITSTKNIGTIYYMAPELIKNTGGYTKSIDIWALGCIWYVLVANDDLFTGQSQQEIKQNLENVTQQKIDDSIERLNLKDWEKQLMKSMINIQVNKRPNIEQIFQQINQQVNPQYTLQRGQNNQKDLQNQQHQLQDKINFIGIQESELQQIYQYQKQQVIENQQRDQQIENLKLEIKQLTNIIEKNKTNSSELFDNQIFQLKEQIDKLNKPDNQFEQIKQELIQNKNSVENKITNLEQKLTQQITQQQQQQSFQQNQQRDQQYENLQQEIEKNQTNSQKLFDNQILQLKEQIDKWNKPNNQFEQIKQELIQNKNCFESKITNLEQNLTQLIDNLNQSPQSNYKTFTQQKYYIQMLDHQLVNAKDYKNDFTQFMLQIEFLQNFYLQLYNRQQAQYQLFDQNISEIFKWINNFGKVNQQKNQQKFIHQRNIEQSSINCTPQRNIQLPNFYVSHQQQVITTKFVQIIK